MRSARTGRNCTICAGLARNVVSSIRHPSDDCPTSAQKDRTFGARNEAPVTGRDTDILLRRDIGRKAPITDIISQYADAQGGLGCAASVLVAARLPSAEANSAAI